jgi:hypothetical protein
MRVRLAVGRSVGGSRCTRGYAFGVPDPATRQEIGFTECFLTLDPAETRQVVGQEPGRREGAGQRER